MYDGVLLINKPRGWTSHDVVAKVRNILKKQAGKKIKVGHTGTLDPMATGLLVLMIGSYTKKTAEFSKMDKSYESTLILGKTSSTGDSEGEKTKVSDKIPKLEEVKKVIKSFIGESQQTPPAYSAVKVGGKRAYKLAREGKSVEIEPRNITIYDISQLSYKYPDISFMVSVSSGTYIRSLAKDIGAELKTGAYLSGLKRTEIGKFKLTEAIAPTEASIDKIIEN